MFLHKTFNSCISFGDGVTWFTPRWGGVGKERGALRVGKANGNYWTRVGIITRGGAIQISWGLNNWIWASIRKYGIGMQLGSFSTKIR